MSGPRALYHMVRADWLERVRRYGFLLTLGLTVYLGYAVYAGYIFVRLGNYRGLRNSAWVGSVMGLTTTVVLSLVGFYIVKNAIQRDRESGVGQILAATPMSRVFYVFGKTLSNFAVLAVMVLILAIAAVIMQVLRPEDTHVQYFALFSPILILGLSALAVTAALAVLFETLPGLRSGAGNIIYFFLWTALLGGLWKAATTHYFADYTGMASVLEQMQAQVQELDPHYHGGASLSFDCCGVTPATRTFLWTGMQWGSALILSRALWLGIAAGIAMLAAVCFDRFDGARTHRASERKPKPAESFDVGGTDNTAVPAARRFVVADLTPLPAIGPRRGVVPARFGALVMAELRLLLRGRGWLWYAGAAGLFIACLAAPLAAARSGVIAAAWLWPVLLWSQMGAREAQFSTQSLIFCGPHAFPRQLLAAWAAGIGVAVLTGGGLGLHLLLAGNLAALTTWASAACFIPALALALGVCTESRKTFEAVYTVWWYLGPLQHIPKLDFIGTSPASSTPGLYVAASVVLVAAACLWRRAWLACA